MVRCVNCMKRIRKTKDVFCECDLCEKNVVCESCSCDILYGLHNDFDVESGLVMFLTCKVCRKLFCPHCTAETGDEDISGYGIQRSCWECYPKEELKDTIKFTILTIPQEDGYITKVQF